MTSVVNSNAYQFRHIALTLVRFPLNFLVRFSMITLGKSNENCNWRVFYSFNIKSSE